MGRLGKINVRYNLLIMVAGNIEERIKKMKEAILTQAKQRAHMIVENANQEADQERTKIYNTEKQKITIQFAHLSKSQKVKEKIEKSALHNRHRILRMQARYEYVQKLKSEVVERLRKVVQNEQLYKELVQKLMVQGMLRLMERHVFIELKGEHINLATSLFAESEKKFSEIMLKQTGKEMESKLSISTYLLQEKYDKMLGGVFMRTNDGYIICDNSLDSRVRLLFEQLLPVIRHYLFPAKKAN